MIKIKKILLMLIFILLVTSFTYPNDTKRLLGNSEVNTIFNYPFQAVLSLAIDGGGNIYLSNGFDGYPDNGIIKFDSHGNFVKKWGITGTSNGQFQGPRQITVDKNNNVYVVDGKNHRIQKFDAEGNFKLSRGSEGNQTGQFFYPSGITTDHQGFVYVADTTNNRIQKFDSNGVFISSWNDSGLPENSFQEPISLITDSNGDIFVTDSHHQQIQKITIDGKLIMKFGSLGTGNSQFALPWGVAIDNFGNIYVVDRNNHRVEKFNPNGNFITTWGSQGSGLNQFYWPSAIIFDGVSHLFIADTGNGRIIRCDLNGNLATTIEPEFFSINSFQPDFENAPTRITPQPENIVLSSVTATVITVPFVAVSQMSQASISSLPLPNAVKEFIKMFGSKLIEQTDKKKLKQRSKPTFLTKSEIGVIVLSVFIVTAVVSFVKAGTFEILKQPVGIGILILTFLSVTIMKLTSVFSDAYCTKIGNIQKRLSFWLIGSATFIGTGVLFHFPFSCPFITRYEEGIPKETHALISFSKIFMLLTLTLPFGILLVFSDPVLSTFSDAGLLATLTTVGYSLLPIPLLPGKSIYDYKKILSIFSVIPMLALLYGFTIQIVPFWLYVIIGILSLIISIICVNKLKSIEKQMVDLN